MNIKKIELRGFKLKDPVAKWALDCLYILRENLTEPRFAMDELKMQMCQSLGGKSTGVPSHVSDLLFNDERLRKNEVWHELRIPKAPHVWLVELIHEEAITYVSAVMGRRLQGAAASEREPTSMHLLFVLLLKYSVSELRWQEVKVERAPPRPTQDLPKELQTMARIFAAQCDKLERTDVGIRKTASNYREQFGPLQLVIGQYAIVMPEEMSLFDVFAALPTALSAKFADDPELQLRFERIMHSLNERYGALRSCGLPPAKWLDRNGPAINVLDNLANLRRTARALYTAPAADTSQGDPNIIDCYRQAFGALKESAKSFAGSPSFDELLQTEYLQEMVKLPTLSIDSYELKSNSDDHGSPVANVVDLGTPTPEDELDLRQQLAELGKATPNAFNDEVVKAFFFRFVLNGEDPGEIITHRDFRHLVISHPEYDGFDEDELKEELLAQTIELIEKLLKKKRNT